MEYHGILRQLSLPMRPHLVTVKTAGWTVAGVHEDGVADADLQLVRVQSGGQQPGVALRPNAMPLSVSTAHHAAQCTAERASVSRRRRAPARSASARPATWLGLVPRLPAALPVSDVARRAPSASHQPNGGEAQQEPEHAGVRACWGADDARATTRGVAIRRGSARSSARARAALPRGAATGTSTARGRAPARAAAAGAAAARGAAASHPKPSRRFAPGRPNPSRHPGRPESRRRW